MQETKKRLLKTNREKKQNMQQLQRNGQYNNNNY